MEKIKIKFQKLIWGKLYGIVLNGKYPTAIGMYLCKKMVNVVRAENSSKIGCENEVFMEKEWDHQGIHYRTKKCWKCPRNCYSREEGPIWLFI